MAQTPRGLTDLDADAPIRADAGLGLGGATAPVARGADRDRLARSVHADIRPGALRIGRTIVELESKGTATTGTESEGQE